MSDNIGQAMQIVKLEGELSRVKTLVSRTINVLIEVRMAVQEEDYDEAMSLLNDALGESP